MSQHENLCNLYRLLGFCLNNFNLFLFVLITLINNKCNIGLREKGIHCNSLHLKQKKIKISFLCAVKIAKSYCNKQKYTVLISFYEKIKCKMTKKKFTISGNIIFFLCVIWGVYEISSGPRPFRLYVLLFLQTIVACTFLTEINAL